ncbi:MAG: OmpA family protein [Bacteroidota bacterium]
MISITKKNLNFTSDRNYTFQFLRFLVLHTFFLLTYPQFTVAQDNGDNLFYIADDFVDNENFTGAINLYQRMLMDDPKNPDLNFKLGFCYLNTADEKDKAIEYIEKSLKLLKNKKKKSNEILEAKFYLAKAYQSNYRFEEALGKYLELKGMTKNKKLNSIVDNEIEKCKTSKDLIANPVEITINNLGDSINSEFSDHSPVVSADEAVLIFTSRRENDYDGEINSDGEFDENIYISYFINDTWTKPESIGENINTSDHEASIGLSVDGQKLFIYKSDDEGSIYLSNLEGDVWSKPQKLGSTINTKARETHASLSADGNSLYFTSDRKGGYGGLDIYVSQRKLGGKWSEAKNLGPTVNTASDERAPYIHPNGITLFYSTKGYGGLGGFDIYTSQINEFGTWTKPKNLGYPINTASDDVFYVPSADGQRAYYASKKEDGYGRSDIYLIGLKEAELAKITIMTGKVHICRGNLPEVSITVMDAKTDEVVGIYTPNSKTGKFLFVLNKGGKYNVIFEANGEIILSEPLFVPESSAYQQLYKVIQIPVTPPCDDDELALMKNKEFAVGINIDNIDENGIVYDKSIKIENILFPYNSAVDLPKNKSLDKLSQYLRSNKDAVIEVGAYADASGRAFYNYTLSVKRGNAVKTYLIKENVKSNQIIVQGYGEENPLTINRNSNGKWNKESMKFNRRIEFRVITQGEKSLLIKPLTNIPKEFKNKKYDKHYKKAESNNVETKE